MSEFEKQRLLNFLLIEDDDDHAVLVMRNLENERVSNQIDRVKDGEEALQFLRGEGQFASREIPDVILLDLKLPKLSGHEVLAAIRNDDVFKKIPVVVLTTSDDESDRERAYSNHANSYLVKPLDFENFRKMVKDLGLYWGMWNKMPPQ